MGQAPIAPDFRVGEWLVEPGLCRISRAGQVAHLRPKLVDLLVFLTSNKDRIVSKEEILQHVWHGEFVVESVLGRSIADLRRLLQDTSVGPRFIETIPKRGYRLIAPVQMAGLRCHEAPLSIAVLPFADLSAGRDQQYFCDGLAEELTNSLCGITGLRVIARTSAFAFRDRAMDVREIARQLGVSMVVEGAVQHAEERLRITVQLIDASDGGHLWSHRFDRPIAGPFAIQDEIAQAVIAELASRLPGQRAIAFVPRHTTRSDAHDLYLRGRYICARRTPSALAEAAECFEAAIQRDPDYALAHSALGECVGISAMMGYVAPQEGFPKALAAARKAVQLGPGLPEGHATLGANLTFYCWQWAEAERAFQLAIRLSPSAALARMWYSHLLAAIGLAEDALFHVTAAQQLDPFSLTIRVALGLRFYEARNWQPAIEHWQATLSMDRDFDLAHFHLGRALGILGRDGEAVRHLQRVAPTSPLALGFLGKLFARLGRHAEARDTLGQLARLRSTRHVGALPFALVHQGLGDADAAIEWYTKAFDAHEGVLPLLIRDPAIDEVRSDPRFAALVRRMQLPGPTPITPHAQKDHENDTA